MLIQIHRNYAITHMSHTLFSASALMQLPNASSDLLMLAPSLSLAPLFVVTVALSDPARSMRDILALVT